MADLGTIDEQFWDYRGSDSDEVQGWGASDEVWYRLPVRYPYSIIVHDYIDETGSLQENQQNGRCEDSEFNERDLGVSHISYFSADESMILYRQDLEDDVHWGIFTFEAGTNEPFETREVMLKTAEERGFKGDKNLKLLADQYRWYWTGE